MAGKLLDVNDSMERSTSPAIPFVLLQVYLREGAKYYGKRESEDDPEQAGDILEGVADTFASAMIPYKDKRMERLEKILQKTPEMVMVNTAQPQQQQPQENRRWWQRKPRGEFED